MCGTCVGRIGAVEKVYNLLRRRRKIRGGGGSAYEKPRKPSRAAVFKAALPAGSHARLERQMSSAKVERRNLKRSGHAIPVPYKIRTHQRSSLVSCECVAIPALARHCGAG